MIGINVIAVGNLKESYLREMWSEYEKRIRAYANLTITEIKEERVSDRPSDAEINLAIQREGERILSAIPKRSFRVALCIEGKMMDSVSLSSRISELASQGYSDFSFIIGGSYGLSDLIKKEADWKLSFSPMTFPHQLMRIILAEQLYRALNISGGGKYHK